MSPRARPPFKRLDFGLRGQKRKDAIRRSYNRASPQPDEAAEKSRIVKPTYKVARELTVA